MRKAYRTLDEVMENFPLWEMEPPKEKTDRVFRATKLEDSIYSDLRMKDEDFQRLEAEAAQKLLSFPALSRDVFQMGCSSTVSMGISVSPPGRRCSPCSDGKGLRVVTDSQVPMACQEMVPDLFARTGHPGCAFALLYWLPSGRTLPLSTVLGFVLERNARKLHCG